MKKTGVFFIVLLGLLFNNCLLKGEKIEIYSLQNYYTSEENITINFEFSSNSVYTDLKIFNKSEELVQQSIDDANLQSYISIKEYSIRKHRS